MLHAVEDLEVFLHDKSPDSRTLTNFRVTFWKEAEGFCIMNNHVAQLTRQMDYKRQPT
jgi:hypothetical protein